MGESFEIPVDGITYVKELYPRLREDDAAIERYRAAIDNLPPVVLARGRVLVDGFHRWQAHRRENRATIRAEDLGNLTDTEILREAIRRNATHGQQLSAEDKQRLAGEFWLRLGDLDVGERSREITELLAVSERTVRRWTKDARRAERERQQAEAWDRWLNCETETRIGERIGIHQTTVGEWVKEFGQMTEFLNPPGQKIPGDPRDWGNVQHFDVWQFGKVDDDAGTESFFGRMPPQVVENLLWLYTLPGWIVFDPFAGGGTTIDVAKRMGRRVWASDLTPSSPLRPIHPHDITAGWPAGAPGKVDFILLDPPYWKQARGRYSERSEDLGNQSLEVFNASWKDVVRSCREHLFPHGFLAFIISPSVDGPAVVDHAFQMYQAVVDLGLIPHRRVIVTYQTQQASGDEVNKARENRQLLKLYRDLCIFRRA